MNIVTGIVVYMMVYCLVFFWVLPWGNKPTGTTDSGKTVASAPINPRIKKKFLITGVISVFVWILIYIVMDKDIISFHDMARSLHQEDMK